MQLSILDSASISFVIAGYLGSLSRGSYDLTVRFDTTSTRRASQSIAERWALLLLPIAIQNTPEILVSRTSLSQTDLVVEELVRKGGQLCF